MIIAAVAFIMTSAMIGATIIIAEQERASGGVIVDKVQFAPSGRSFR